MKKTLALILAAMMVAGTASVAFAASDDVWFVDNSAKDYYLYDDNAEYLVKGGDIRKGDTVYFQLDNKFDPDDEKKEMDKVKVKAEWTHGSELVESVKIEYKKCDASAGGYAYFVAIATKDVVDVTIDDLVGTLKVYRSSPNNPYELGKLKLNFNEAGYETVTWNGEEDYDATVKCKTDGDYVDPVVKFKNLEEITIVFEGIGEYDINVKDQEKLFLGFDKDVNKEIADKYDYAELDFVNFPGAPKFNRTGIFYLYVDEADSFVYALKDGKLEAVKATYDEEYEAMKFSLRNFPDSLIISDTELEIVNDETSSSEAPAEGETTPSETVKPNPGTGR